MNESQAGRAAASMASQRDTAVAYLLSRINYEQIPASPYAARTVKLDRMRMLLHRLGSPDAGMPILHVAGTKGKGSVSAIAAHILHAAGYDVGVFSSPHLERIEERFCINGRPCHGDELAALVERIRPVVAQLDAEADESGDPSLKLTFFELNTAIALLYFAERKVDLVVLEVGLGGRLDATNVCQSTVSAVTSISLDHTRQLGATVEAIAREKAGIIKPGVPVVVGPMLPGPRDAILETARQRGARPVLCPDDFRFAYRCPPPQASAPAPGRLDFQSVVDRGPHEGPPLRIEDAPLGLLGGHQAANAAVALAAIDELRRQGWLVSTTAIRAGLADVSLPGRVEVVGSCPTTVLDVAHNAASAAALVDCLQQHFLPRRRLLVLAATRDKDVRGIVRLLLPHFQRVFATCYIENPRGLPVDRLLKICREELLRLGRDEDCLSPCESPEIAWRSAMDAAAPEDLVCVTGSFFIVSELRRYALTRR